MLIEYNNKKEKIYRIEIIDLAKFIIHKIISQLKL